MPECPLIKQTDNCASALVQQIALGSISLRPPLPLQKLMRSNTYNTSKLKALLWQLVIASRQSLVSSRSPLYPLSPLSLSLSLSVPAPVESLEQPCKCKPLDNEHVATITQLPLPSAPSASPAPSLLTTYGCVTRLC